MIRSAAMAIAWAIVEAGSTVIIRPFLRIMSAGGTSGVAGDLCTCTCVFAEWLLARAPMKVALAPAMKWRRRINLFVRRPVNPYVMRAPQAARWHHYKCYTAVRLSGRGGGGSMSEPGLTLPSQPVTAKSSHRRWAADRVEPGAARGRLSHWTQR